MPYSQKNKYKNSTKAQLLMVIAFYYLMFIIQKIPYVQPQLIFLSFHQTSDEKEQIYTEQFLDKLSSGRGYSQKPLQLLFQIYYPCVKISQITIQLKYKFCLLSIDSTIFNTRTFFQHNSKNPHLKNCLKHICNLSTRRQD